MSGIEFDYSQFKQFVKNFTGRPPEEEFIKSVMNKLGNVSLQELKSNTPVGQYDGTIFYVTGDEGDPERHIAHFEVEHDTRTGGELRRNWILGDVERVGDMWRIKVTNNTEYGPWVEKGHRKADHSGWVEGQFFVETSVDNLKGKLPKIIGPEWRKYLESFGL